MKTLLTVLLVVGMGLVAGAARAEEKKKETTLTGTLVCAKCALKAEGVKKCTNAIQVKEDGKEVVYFLEDEGQKASYHDELCGGGSKEGTVVGVVSKKDGKSYIKPSKVEFKK